MPNDYGRVRAARDGNKSRIVIESPGVRDETEKKAAPAIKMGQGMHQVEPGDPGTGKYSDRIKLEPKFGFKEPPPRKSDIEIHEGSAKREITT